MRAFMQHETFNILPSEGQCGISTPYLKAGDSMPLGSVIAALFVQSAGADVRDPERKYGYAA
jgi:hypothetical protein